MLINFIQFIILRNIMMIPMQFQNDIYDIYMYSRIFFQMSHQGNIDFVKLNIRL